MKTREVERCASCGGVDFEPKALRYEFGGTSFPLVECRSCGLRFLIRQPDPQALRELYGAEYFEADYRCGRAAASSFDPAAPIEEDRGLLDAFAALRPPGRLLDVGCAAGWLLEHAAARGWRATGVELSEAAASFARGRGLQVFQGTLEDAALPAEDFDLIYMGDVLEHVPDCRATLVEVRRLLAPGGHLFLRGPITTHSIARSLALAVAGAVRRPIVLREPPYHLWEFTPRSLEVLLRSVDLELLRLVQSKIPPGRPHGEKSAAQRLAMNLIDAVNLPITSIAGVRGDRVTLVARRPSAQAPPVPSR